MAGSDDPAHLHAKPAQGLDMHRADEAGSNDRGTYLGNQTVLLYQTGGSGMANHAVRIKP